MGMVYPEGTDFVGEVASNPKVDGRDRTSASVSGGTKLHRSFGA